MVVCIERRSEDTVAERCRGGIGEEWSSGIPADVNCVLRVLAIDLGSVTIEPLEANNGGMS